MSVNYQLSIDNLSCGGCVGRAEAAVEPIKGVDSFAVNLTTHQAQLVLNDASAYPDVIESLEKAGYPATKTHTPPSEGARPQHRGHPWKIAAGLTAPLFVIEMTRHLLPGLLTLSQAQLAAWNAIQFLLATAVVLGPGRNIFEHGIAALRRLAPNMNSLVVVGAGSAYLYSTAVWLAQTGDGLYFEATAVICTLILLGRQLEDGAKGKTGAAIESLAQMTPKTTLRWQEDQWARVQVSETQTGDRLKVLPGDALPVDGTLETEAWVDESFLTGEPEAQSRKPAERVYAGSLNAGQSALEISATATGQATALAGIIAMVEHAQATRLPIQAIINRITLWFVPIVMALAAATFAVWWHLDSFETAVMMAVSVLIIACPCAMGLATPTSVVVGMGRAASHGVLFRNGESLQVLPNAKTIAFDKTGTLTQGKPEIVNCTLFESIDEAEVRSAVAGLESESNHPLAKALDYSELTAMSEVEQIAGAGLRGIDPAGRSWAVGKMNWLSSTAGQDPEFTPLYPEATRVGVTCNNEWVACFEVTDPIREGALDALSQLKAQGHQLVMLSGDRSETAQAVAQKLEIDQAFGELTPDAKLSKLAELPGPVVFVGDGVNDGPALARADVGIAIGSGVDVAIESADVVLVNAHLESVGKAIGIGRATMRNIRQNLAWAFGYNVALIPVAMGLWGSGLSPMLAAGAMALSSICVVTNALRLRWA